MKIFKTIYLILSISSLLLSKEPVNAFKYQRMLNIGINVNWVNFKKEICDYSEKVPYDFKKIGFNTVRIRYDFSKLKKLKLTREKYINLIKKVVNDSLKNGLIVVLANGAKEFKLNPNKKTEKKLINDWLLVANTFKNYSYKVSYDFIIEPGKNLSKYKLKNNWILNDFYKKLYNKIRNIDKYRILIWGPNRLSNPFYLSKTWYPDNDRYVIAEWHMYAAGPKNDYKKMIPIKTLFAYNWSKQHKIPTWVGAWMPGNYNHGNNYTTEEQIKFSKFMIYYLKKYNIPFAINADQQFYNIKIKKWRKDRKLLLTTIIDYYYSN